MRDLFEGTLRDLFKAVTPVVDDWKPLKGWPSSARVVTGSLRRLAPAARKTEWTVMELPPGHANAIRWHPVARAKAGARSAGQQEVSRARQAWW
jgi:hypothetical protein